MSGSSRAVPPPGEKLARLPDRKAMAAAIAAFLEAAGLDLAGDLVRTPGRVAKAWSEDFLDGYGCDPVAALGELHPAPDAGLVCVTGLDFHSSCPHHLLPYRGLAHVAYLPCAGARAQVVGFSRLAELVDVLSHRLVLQETLARSIAETLQLGTGARGAGCVLEAEQVCLTCRAQSRSRARVTASAFTGTFSTDGSLSQRLYAAIAAGLVAPRELTP